MINRVVLTDKKVASLKPARPGKRYDILDALMPNLLLRVTETGHKTFMFRARFPGKVNPRTGQPSPSRRELGKVGAMTIAEARDIACRGFGTKERVIHQ